MITAFPWRPLHRAQFVHVFSGVWPCLVFNGFFSGTMCPIVGASDRSPFTVFAPHNKQTNPSRLKTKSLVTDESKGRLLTLHRSLWPCAGLDFRPLLLFLRCDSLRHSTEHSLSRPFRNIFPQFRQAFCFAFATALSALRWAASFLLRYAFWILPTIRTIHLDRDLSAFFRRNSSKLQSREQYLPAVLYFGANFSPHTRQVHVFF